MRYIITYCLSCKKLTKDVNIKAKVTKNKKHYITANCSMIDIIIWKIL